MISCRLLGHLSGLTFQLSAAVRCSEPALESPLEIYALLSNSNLLPLHLPDVLSRALARILSPGGVGVSLLVSLLSFVLFAFKALDLRSDYSLCLDASELLILLFVSMQPEKTDSSLKMSDDASFGGSETGNEETMQNLRIARLLLDDLATNVPEAFAQAWQACLSARSRLLPHVAELCLILLRSNPSAVSFLGQLLTSTSPLGCLHAISIALENPQSGRHQECLLTAFSKALTDLPTLVIETSLPPCDGVGWHKPILGFKQIWLRLRESHTEAM